MTDYNTNLAKLAGHLETLPDDYAQFDMSFFYLGNGWRDAEWVINQPIQHDCGTVACAIGHGPSAGILAEPNERWNDYTERAFGVLESSLEWDYLFSGEWADWDNTPKGTASRIRTYIAEGVPSTGWWNSPK